METVRDFFEAHDTEGTGLIPRGVVVGLLQRLGAHFDEAQFEHLLGSATIVDYRAFLQNLGAGASEGRNLSLPHEVQVAGGVAAWNGKNSDVSVLGRMLSSMCRATTVEEALAEVRAITSMGPEHHFWAYAYMRRLYGVDLRLYYSVLVASPSELLPVVYTPTVGEACQKYGMLPMARRGCYVSISERGRVKQVLEEYARAELSVDGDGNFLCDCIVFSDGGRILGLGDLGAWGMGIPIGKLDLYTVCAGVSPYRTMPVIIDAGCYGPEGNTDHLTIRDHELYTGLKQARVTEKSAVGTVVNSAYHEEGSFIGEFMQAATELFGTTCLLQFEDFNSNDAFPLLAKYREEYLCYNDDIQGTASVGVAALLGAMRLRDSACANLGEALRKQTFLFHGAGSANIGIMRLLCEEGGVPKSSIFVTNSRGLIWRSEDGAVGNFRNDEQKEFGQVGEPTFDSKDLVKVIENIRPSCIIGAVGVAPGCFTKAVVEATVSVNSERPVVFALSNPKSQAEITASDAYKWSDGRVIYGSGTWFPTVTVNGKQFRAAQVNNVYIFPGISFGAICCHAKRIPERFFMVAAEAVAQSLTDEEMQTDSILPFRDRIQEVSLNVATAVVLEAQVLGIAARHLGSDTASVKARIAEMRWSP